MPETENRRECATGRLAGAQCAQIGETENVLQQTKAGQASSVECSDRTWRNGSEAGVDRPPLLFGLAKSTRYSTPRRSAEIHVFGSKRRM